jgi:hypothetical protein
VVWVGAIVGDCSCARVHAARGGRLLVNISLRGLLRPFAVSMRWDVTPVNVL